MRAYIYCRHGRLPPGGCFGTYLYLILKSTIASSCKVLGKTVYRRSFVKVLRVVRVLRCVRVLRMISLFADLWLIVQSFFLCLKPLLWTCVFNAVIIFIFANFASQLVNQHDALLTNPGVQMHFASLFPAMVTLFQLATLDEWIAVLDPVFLEAM